MRPLNATALIHSTLFSYPIACPDYIANKIQQNNQTYDPFFVKIFENQNFIPIFVDVYKQYLEKLLNKNNIWTEQVIYTHIYKEHPELFYKLCDGYGTISLYLYGI